jgi:hypothetical protein
MIRCSSISICTLLATPKTLDRRVAARRMFRFLSIEHLFSVKIALAASYKTKTPRKAIEGLPLPHWRTNICPAAQILLPRPMVNNSVRLYRRPADAANKFISPINSSPNA